MVRYGVALSALLMAVAPAGAGAAECQPDASGTCAFIGQLDGLYAIEAELESVVNLGGASSLTIAVNGTPCTELRVARSAERPKAVCYAYLMGGMTYRLDVATPRTRIAADALSFRIREAQSSNGQPVVVP